jgi:hypothetical protein
MVKHLIGASLGLAVLGSGALQAQTRVSEILYNPPGVDLPNEYVELVGSPGAALGAGTYLLGIEGDSSTQPGDVQTIFDLSGLTFGANGYMVLLPVGSPYAVDPLSAAYRGTGSGFAGVGSGFSADAGAADIENASVSFLLIQAATAPALTTDIDSNNDGVADGTSFASWTVLDAVGALDGGGSDFGYAPVVFLGSAGGAPAIGTPVPVSFTAGYLARLGGGDSATDWVAAEVTGTNPASYTFSNASLPALAGADLADAGLGADNAALVPEPSTWAFMTIGLAALGAARLRRRRGRDAPGTGC